MSRIIAAAYRSGTAAHKRGKTIESNPYLRAGQSITSNAQAFAWHCAWISARDGSTELANIRKWIAAKEAA